MINLKGKDQIAAVAKVEKDDEDVEESSEVLTDGNDQETDSGNIIDNTDNDGSEEPTS